MPSTRVVSTALLLLMALTACSAESTEAAEEESAEAAESAEETVSLEIRLSTNSGLLGSNHDDESCLWLGTEYVLRNGDGGILASGDAESIQSGGGEATIGDRPAQIGTVTGTDPYECTLGFNISDVKRSDFYELEISTEETLWDDTRHSTSEIFSDEDAESKVEISIGS